MGRLAGFKYREVQNYIEAINTAIDELVHLLMGGNL